MPPPQRANPRRSWSGFRQFFVGRAHRRDRARASWVCRALTGPRESPAPSYRTTARFASSPPGRRPLTAARGGRRLRAAATPMRRPCSPGRRRRVGMSHPTAQAFAMLARLMQYKSRACFRVGSPTSDARPSFRPRPLAGSDRHGRHLLAAGAGAPLAVGGHRRSRRRAAPCAGGGTKRPRLSASRWIAKRDLNMATLLEEFRSNYSASHDEEMGLEEYLDLCKREPAAYATAAERMLAAIGEPELVDTRNDPRLSRIFGNRVIRRYPAFREFYGMEDAIDQIVAFFKHAAQGLEEKKQILYLLGPVGGGKSSIAERLKTVMEMRPIYAIKGSPVNESPLGLFPPERFALAARDGLRHPAPLPDRHHVAVGAQAAARIRRRHVAVPRRAGATRPCCARWRSPRPSRATRTTRTSRRWSARSTSASSNICRRTIPTPTATRAACASPTRACSSSSRCSRRRSRCCTRC